MDSDNLNPEKKISRWQKFKNALKILAPGPAAWRGAAVAVLVTFFLLLAVTHAFFGAYGGVGIALALILASSLLIFLLSRLLYDVGRLLGKTPLIYRYALLVMLLVSAAFALFAAPLLYGMIAVMMAILAAVSLLGAGLAVIFKTGVHNLAKGQRRLFFIGFPLGLVLLAGIIVFLAWDGAPARPPLNAAAQNASQVSLLDQADPSTPGPYAVAELTYGSGDDKRRPEFGTQAGLVTARVDGSLLVEKWSPLRTAFWGFGPEAMPLNGRVWYPQGQGPFPLVIAVHGNHPMEHYSDLGYAYLGELLASRGYIFVSVDQNFLNLSGWGDMLFFSQLIRENDARGWLLLEHLREWRDWNNQPGNPFYQQVDLQNIALIGHSRGGEAIVVAAAFNQLAHYPDDASLVFDYGFKIRSLVAIAPADGQYRPTGVRTPFANVNYLLLHGAHDMDVLTMMGSNAYDRLRFSGEDFYFKSAYYIYGANHGQFNSDWGNKDLFEPFPRLYNLRQLLDAQEQEKIAQVLISAFLDTTLREEQGYLPLFQDQRAGRNWLPDTLYLTQYHDSRTQLISDFSEDIDLTSTSLPGGRLEGIDLTRWREETVKGKWGEFNFKGVFLGWDRDTYAAPAYKIHLPEDGLSTAAESILSLSLADANENPLPAHLRGDRPAQKENGEREPIDLTIRVIDRNGSSAAVPLSRYALLQPQIEGTFAKAAFMHATPRSEPVFQTFDFPLAWFTAVNPQLDIKALESIQLIFDRSPSGVIILKDLGLR